jgi:thioredoxin-dependent peroxiredoxin
MGCVSLMPANVMDKAPLFEATADDGTKFSLGEVIGKTNLVLYFYPKDFTTGCTREACAFRDSWEKVQALGATIIGVSSDNQETHARFKKEHSLQFKLVSDEKRGIRKLYGVDGRFVPPRSTFVIDKGGVIRSVFNSQLNISKHVEQALHTLETIEGK